MIDISKWLVIILIFFVAFACSLFLIFSYFAVSVQHRHLLAKSSATVPTDPSTSIFGNASTQVSFGRCPSAFFALTNRSFSDSSAGEAGNNGANAGVGFCAKIGKDDQLKIKRVGTSPGVYYFGRSFGATTLTTFFTLFGVIAEDRIAVGDCSAEFRCTRQRLID